MHDTMTVKMNFTLGHSAAITANGRRSCGTSLTTLLVLVAVASALSRPVDAEVMNRLSANAPERRQVHLVHEDAQPNRGRVPRTVRPSVNQSFRSIHTSDIAADRKTALPVSVCGEYVDSSVSSLNPTLEEFREHKLNLPPPVDLI